MYYLVMNGTQAGPFSIEQLRGFWAEGHINGETVCWFEGQSEWLSLHALNLPLREPAFGDVRAPAGFWRRLGAWIIDVAILWLVGLLLGVCLFKVFILLSVWAFLVGLVICTGYFGVMNSVVGGGATVGKKLLGIEVVDPAGQHLPLPRACLRYLIFSSPFWLNYLLGTFYLEPDSPLFIGLSSIIGFAGVIIGYLLVFNWPTRQSLHDLIAHTYVVRAQSRGPVRELPFWKGHVVAVGVIMAVLVAFGFGGEAALKYSHFNFDQMVVVQKDVMAQGPFRSVSINHGINYMAGSAGASKTDVVSVTVTWKGQPPDEKTFPAEAKAIAAVVLKDYPTAQTSDSVNIAFRWGYDIGIWSGWMTQYFNRSPADWQQAPTATDK